MCALAILCSWRRLHNVLDIQPTTDVGMYLGMRHSSVMQYGSRDLTDMAPSVCSATRGSQQAGTARSDEPYAPPAFNRTYPS